MEQSSPDTKHHSSAMSRTQATLHSTTQLLRRHPWSWPLLFAVVLGIAGWFVQRAMARTISARMADELQTILDADVTALRIWLRSRQDRARSIAASPFVREAAVELANVAHQGDLPRRDLLDSPWLKEIRDFLRPICEADGYIDFAIMTADGRIVASANDEPLGLMIPEEYETYAQRLRDGESIVQPPEIERMPFRSWSGEVYLGQPVMSVGVAVHDDHNQVLGILSLTMRPTEFSEILQVARMGDSGETYAFNRQGQLLSRSRFESQLKRIGLLPDQPEMESTLKVEIRDPGVNLVDGGRPNRSRSEQPLTKMAQQAVDQGSGIDVDGYNDYRGVPVIGAWTWLDDYDFGVTTEVDVAEAFEEFALLKRFAWMNFGLLLAASLGILVTSSVISRQEEKLRRARLKARRLGQYSLEEKLGEGGMGAVYRGHHAMLRRPTAIKLLHDSKTSEQSIARFEREVQTTSELTHPNTIIIYDFGRTPEGVFYYAMEYLSGTNLSQLIELHGPQPAGRLIHILTQVCGSLAEAHERGLIHRDIKPANIVLTRRGAMYDFVKVVDFGLVKVVDSAKEATLTMAGSMTGTPHYMSPEAIQEPESVDARSDLYALGAVGFWLLTGRTVFKSEHVFEVCTKHIEEPPQRPSDVLGRDVGVDLEAVLLQCLEKDKQQRPSTAEDLRQMLLRCDAADAWTESMAAEWWERCEPSRSAMTLPLDTTGAGAHTRTGN